MSANRPMDPDRYQMKSLKRRVTQLERQHKSDQKHMDRVGARTVQIKKDLADDSHALLKRIERLESVVSDLHSRFPKDLWDQ